MQKINIWTLGKGINVKLEPVFLVQINKKIKEKYGTKKKIHTDMIKTYSIAFSTFKSRLKTSYRYFIDLEIITNLCKILDIPLKEMQENIISYKSRRGLNSIENPILPINITPLFDMLIAHHIADGTVVDPKRGRRPYFSYRQYDQENMQHYKEKIEAVFGKIRKDQPYRDKTRTYFPTVVATLLFSLYNLNTRSFLSKKARIPKKLFTKSWKHQLAFLLGIIIDDGTVDSTMIVIVLKNKPLIRDLQKLCQTLRYTTKITEREGIYQDYGYLHINKEGMRKLWKDYCILKKEYPQVNLGVKGKRIKQNLNIEERHIIRTKGNRKIILSLFSKKDWTVNELAKEILMTRQGIRFHIHILEKEGKIKQQGRKGASYSYTLKPLNT